MDNDYSLNSKKEQKHKKQIIKNINLELTGINTTILQSKNFEQTIIYLEFAALALEEKAKDAFCKFSNDKLPEKTVLALLQEKIFQVRSMSYENLRQHTINQGDQTEINTLRNISWEGSNSWEKDFRIDLLRAILKKKINFNTTPPLSDEILDQELKDIGVRVQLDLIEGFSNKPSLYALYQAYNCTYSSLIKKALTNHVVRIIKTHVKTKIMAISFIGISIVLWSIRPYLEKRYPNEIRYLYELIALVLLNRPLA